VNGSSTITLPKKYSLEVAGNYFSKSLMGIAEIKPFHTLTIGVQKELNNDQGILKFSVSDIFKGSNWRWVVDNPNIDFVNTGAVLFTERVFRLTYSKRFGNTKVKGERKRATGSAAEKRRLN